MKIINFNIRDENTLDITCKKRWYERYSEEINELTSSLEAKDLDSKYLGWGLDKNQNIVFSFVLRDFDKDIKPYIINPHNEKIMITNSEDVRQALIELSILLNDDNKYILESIHDYINKLEESNRNKNMVIFKTSQNVGKLKSENKRFKEKIEHYEKMFNYLTGGDGNEKK